MRTALGTFSTLYPNFLCNDVPVSATSNRLSTVSSRYVIVGLVIASRRHPEYPGAELVHIV